MDRRNFLLGSSATLAAASLDSITNHSFAQVANKWVVGEHQVSSMVTHMLGLNPKDAEKYFPNSSSIKPKDQIAFNSSAVPADKQGAVNAKITEWDKHYGAPTDGIFAVPSQDYNAAVHKMTHGNLNGEQISRGVRVLTMYHLLEQGKKSSIDGVVRRFRSGPESANDEIGSPSGAIYQAVRAQDVAKAMKEIEGKFVFGLGNVFDKHPEVAKAFAAYIKTGKVGIQNPLENHYVIDKQGNLLRQDPNTGMTSPLQSSPTPAAVADMYKLITMGPGFETTTSTVGRIGTSAIYKR